MNPKTKRRWHSEASIIRSIDTYSVKLRDAGLQLVSLEQRIKLALASGAELWFVNKLRDDQALNDRRIIRIEQKLQRLKTKLAEFRTPQLVGVDNGDRSIPV